MKRIMALAAAALALAALACAALPARAHDFSMRQWLQTEEAQHEITVQVALPLAVARNVLRPRTVASEDLCSARLAAFADMQGHVTVRCEGDWLLIDAPGLPPAPATDADRIMVGIQAWIQRVPLPYAFHWRLPLTPQYVSPPQAASPRGPIAVAIDGVPIFHLDRRPDGDTTHYDPRHDVVLGDELDQCGGHAGQGEDYHYHYAPVCLVDTDHLDRPIGFGLDGIPIYYGTGGTAYFGRGRLDGIDNLPLGALDRCNGTRLPDGTIAYYTTATPPYVIGCHEAVADPTLRIEPRPLRGRDQRTASALGVGEYGEAVHTLVTDFYQDADGWYHLEFNALQGSGTGAVLYRRAASGNDCWDFESRPNAAQPGRVETACR